MSFFEGVAQKFQRRPGKVEPPSNTIFPELDKMSPLLRLMEERTLVDLVCARSNARFQSMIIGVNLWQRHLEMDELFSTSDIPHLHPHSIYRVEHYRDGEVFCFDTRLIDTPVSNGYSWHCFSLPTGYYARKRRQHTRMSLSRQHPIGIILESRRGDFWHASALNISSRGMRLAMGGNLLDRLSYGSQLDRCEFRIGNALTVNCSAKVRAISFSRYPSRQTEISIEFESLPARQAAFMEDLINSCRTSTAA